MTHTFTCEQCDAQFHIEYDDEVIDDSPTYCAFCGEYVMTDRDAPPSLRGFTDDDTDMDL